MPCFADERDLVSPWIFLRRVVVRRCGSKFKRIADNERPVSPIAPVSVVTNNDFERANAERVYS